MKKLLLSLSVFAVATVLVVNLATSYIGNTDPATFFRKLPDYNWNESLGDRMTFTPYDGRTVDVQQDKVVSSKTVSPQFDHDIIDYRYFNTGFQSGYEQSNSIIKQGVTGAPTSKIFMPNGNEAKDFGITNRAERYNRSNSFLTWDPLVDMDSKFNKTGSNDIFVTKTPVAAKWVASQHPEVRGQYAGFASVGHRSPVGNGIGLKNPWNNNYTSYQYLDSFVDWGGSFFEGLIKIPSADSIEAAHKNGVKSFGTIFLDGFHGLTKTMLIDFLKKDSKGNFLIADILIKMADYFGFDGYFWNSEANGKLPNGTILDFRDLATIFQQINELKKAHPNPRIQNLQQVYFSAYGTFTYNSLGIPNNLEIYEMSRYADEVVLNFAEEPEKLVEFWKDRPDWEKKKFAIYNIAEMSRTRLHGFYDSRFLTSQWQDENRKSYNGKSISADLNANNKMTFGSDVFSSISNYEDHGAAHYGIEAVQILHDSLIWKELVKTKQLTKKQRELYLNLFAQQVTNIFEDALYTGRNRFLRTPASQADVTKDEKYKGKVLWANKTNLKRADLKVDATVEEDYGITNRGYNAAWEAVDHVNVVEAMDVIPTLGFPTFEFVNDNQKRWLFAKDINDNYVYSFGTGALILEKTVLNSQNLTQPDWEFKTNFSTGSGIFFKDKNDYQWQKYPWSDKRMIDVTPTYRWDVRKLTNDDLTDPIFSNELANFSQNEVSGFFDYYNIHEKGNSIGLAKMINYDGSLNGFNFKNPILWNLMGTNFKSHEVVNKNFSFALQANTGKKWNDENQRLAIQDLVEVQLAVSVIDQNQSEATYFLPFTTIAESKLHDGWTNYEVSGNKISNLFAGKNVTVSKLGLAIKQQQKDLELNDFVFNVGHFAITNQKVGQIVKVSQLDLNVEYLIDRKNFLNLRFSWDAKNSVDVKYYEVYQFDELTNQIYRLGETTNDAYFVKNLSQANEIVLGIKPIYEQGGNDEIFKFRIQRRGK